MVRKFDAFTVEADYFNKQEVDGEFDWVLKGKAQYADVKEIRILVESPDIRKLFSMKFKVKKNRGRGTDNLYLILENSLGSEFSRRLPKFATLDEVTNSVIHDYYPIFAGEKLAMYAYVDGMPLGQVEADSDLLVGLLVEPYVSLNFDLSKFGDSSEFHRLTTDVRK